MGNVRGGGGGGGAGGGEEELKEVIKGEEMKWIKEKRERDGGRREHKGKRKR